MPKIMVKEVSPHDKPLCGDTSRYIEDLLAIQCSKAYVNEKKQLQELSKKLYDVGYYLDIDNESVFKLFL